VQAVIEEDKKMKATLVGPYPRIGSECGDKLRKELNRSYEGSDNAELVQSLMKDLTREVVKEMVSVGIDLPNCGLINVHDELTWPLEHADGVEFGGMKKIFHTNTHFREAIVNDKIRRKESLLGDLFGTALEVHPTVKVEFPGPYTMAKHSVLGKDSPYRSLEDLAEAYAKLFREELSELKGVSLVQFNEPSIIAVGTRSENRSMVPELYRKMLNGLNLPVALWTFYGKYSRELVDMLLSLPVDVIGFDFVWDPNIDDLLSKTSHGKGIGIGLIDSGDRGYVQFEALDQILDRLAKLKGHVNLDESFLSSNATLEHLPRDHARRKAALIGEATRRINQ